MISIKPEGSLYQWKILRQEKVTCDIKKIQYSGIKSIFPFYWFTNMDLINSILQQITWSTSKAKTIS